ncbi:MAG TPA: ATP-binding protein [Chloroflexia bacterium]|nr:ATP-binding protein [Chloroflexia bacterium]
MDSSPTTPAAPRSELAARTAQQIILAQLGLAALASPDLPALLDAAVIAVAQGLAVDYAEVLELLPGGDALLLRAGVGWAPGLVGVATVGTGPESPAGYILRARQPVIVTDLPTETRFRGTSLLQEHGIISGLSVLIHSRDRPYGVLSAHTTQRRDFSQDDVSFLQAVANLLALAIEREQAETARRAQEVAEAANAAKNDFLSRMSHELRTPLNVILGFGQILERTGLTPDQQESLQHILRTGQHLLALINEILDLARIEAGRISISPEPVPIGELIRECLDLIRPIAAQARVTLQTDIPPAGDDHVLADYQRLKQVMLNLLANAVKYNHAGGSVFVSCEAGPLRVRILVGDTGAGIAPEQMGRLFTPFERLGAEHHGVEGTGLGLALAKGLVEAMGGQVGARSTVGQGSTFWVELARVAGPVPLLGPAGPAPTIPATASKPARTVLYVEDNLSNLRLIEAILRPYPTIKLLTAMQGALGLQLAQAHQPDLILLDVHLPDMTGAEVLQALRAGAETAAIPVVVISADATAGQIARLLAAGAQIYLTKPLIVREFLGVLERILYAGLP